MDKGWVSIHRKILKNPILKMNRSYSRFEAWIYLLLRATYNNQKVVLGSDIYELKSGEILTSQKKLCKQFKWGNSRLRTFLKLLQKDGMINVKTNSKLTHLTILNYNKLQRNQIATKSLTNHNQIHSNKDINKDNKESLKIRFEKFLEKCKDELPNEHPEYDSFVNWWAEYNEGGSKMKWEKQKTFNLNMRWATWVKRSRNPETKKITLDDKFPLDKTGNARLGKCSKCKSTVFLDKWKPILDSSCCNAKVIGKGE